MPLQNTLRKKLREPGKYAQAVLRWRRLSFGEAPPIFGNSKPKSGSHLLLQILNGFTKIMPYTYTAAEPVRTIRKEGGRRSAKEVAVDLAAIYPAVIGWGYVEASPENLAILCHEGRVNYFIYRDPRDMLISQAFFATDMHTGHGMHAYYQSLPDFDARLKVAIMGIDQDGLKMVSVRERYAGVFEWLNQPRVMCIRFEDLINDRDATLNAMLDEIEKTGYQIPTPREEAIAILVEAINPKKSHTFRSGKTGGWRDHFSEENKDIFKEVAGDLLLKLGYEENNDW
ncbi:MAG: sulfotransferase domain-containing protein [Anaerolineae bacterium]|nr:sulfotransferase domain-containing protein [Anaerolineae bacterium]